MKKFVIIILIAIITLGTLGISKIYLDETTHPRIVVLVSFGNVTENGLLPVIVTEKTFSPKPISIITSWEFFPTDFGLRDEQNNPIGWSVIKQSQDRMKLTVDGVDLNDYRPIRNGFSRDSLNTVNAVCGSQNIKIIYAGAIAIPIPPSTDILAKKFTIGITPNEKSEYKIQFASFFENKIVLPQNAITLSQKSVPCNIENMYPNAKYDEIVFKLSND